MVRLPAGALKNGAGTASLPRVVMSTPFCGDESSASPLARVLERILRRPAFGSQQLEPKAATTKKWPCRWQHV